MIRLVFSFLVAALVCIPALTAAQDVNSSDTTGDYLVQQCAVISFSEEKLVDTPGNLTLQTHDESANQTRPGGEMSAQKLFELKQAAREDLRKMSNSSMELSVGLSPSAAQSVAIVCKQCIPESKK